MLPKMHSCVFCQLQLITVLILSTDSYASSSTRLISQKTCLEFSIFDSILSLLKFIFLFNKKHGHKIHQINRLKGHRCKFKTDKITYSELQCRTMCYFTKNKPNSVSLIIWDLSWCLLNYTVRIWFLFFM